MQHNEPVTVIFVTGGLGSGKSTFTRICAKRGIKTLSADEIVNDLYEKNLLMVEKLKSVLGDEIVRLDGKVDKAIIASKIFSEPKLLEQVEAIIHPLVREEILEQAKSAENLVYEIPIINEKSDLSIADYLVVISISETEQINRAVSRGMSRDDALARIDAQRKNVFKYDNAVIISNEGSPTDFDLAVNEFLDRVIHD